MSSQRLDRLIANSDLSKVVLQYAAKEQNQRPFYSLNGFVTRSISLPINFFRIWCLVSRMNVVFSSKSTLQFSKNNFCYWIAGGLKPCVQNGIIICVVAPYYNLTIHRTEIFASKLHHGKKYS
jgi:uncharacterized membrane protein